MKQRECSLPSPDQIRAERQRLKGRAAYGAALRGTIYILLIVAAVSVLIAFLILPVLQISGESMVPTLCNKDVVVLVKTDNLKTGDLIAFSFNNKTLIKRVIAGPGEWVEVDEEGYVYVNGSRLEEPYVQDRSLGECDQAFPIQVGEDSFFVMGDHRESSVDSRSSLIGFVSEEQLIGKLLFRVYPFDRAGAIR